MDEDDAARDETAAADEAGNDTPAEGSDAVHDSERVEKAFEQWAQRVGRILAVGAARAREEAEDILAEAQSIRRGERE